MTKVFDCVDMKRKAQARIHQALKGLNPEEERQYWRERGKELEDLRGERLREKTPFSGRSPAK